MIRMLVEAKEYKVKHKIRRKYNASNPALWQTTLKNDLRRENSNVVDETYSTKPAVKRSSKDLTETTNTRMVM